MIEERGLSHVAQFRKGNAFDYDSLATLDPAPTLGIVSGLYELFPDNDLIKRRWPGWLRLFHQAACWYTPGNRGTHS